jgi:hypothetical protein
MLVLVGSVSLGATATFAQSRPAVIELYTSEGCSSCPPAEAYLGELAERRDVLALSFHVDYWDDLGWRDRFALPAAVDRQRAYAKALRLASVYTPQAVIDGTANFVGSDRAAIGRALTGAGAGSGTDSGRDAARRPGVGIELAAAAGGLNIALAPHAGVTPSDILLIAYQRDAKTPVGRGENSGRTLSEFNVVRDFHSLGLWRGEARQFHVRGDSLPPGTTDVAVIVQTQGQSAIIGAATVMLN